MFNFFNSNHQESAFVKLNTRKCKACWDCIAACKSNVLGKIDLPWHKHSIIANAKSCTGCFVCVKTCKYDAFIKI
ncbi:MAG: FeS-binding protein [Bacteroidales bacterium]|nr:FeS-binding protein [Bacteroidales bacterium]